MLNFTKNLQNCIKKYKKNTCNKPPKNWVKPKNTMKIFINKKYKKKNSRKNTRKNTMKKYTKKYNKKIH